MARPPSRLRLAPAHRIEFYRQMDTLLSSGVLIADALERLKDRYPDPGTRRVLDGVHAGVTRSNRSLSQAMAFHPRAFPAGAVAAVQAGEQAGAARLAERFADLAGQEEFDEACRRQVRSACAYPAFASAMALGLGALLLGVVFPRITDLLASLGAGLPPLARGVVEASRLLRAAAPAFLAACLAAAVLWAALRRLPRPRLALDRLLLRLPVAGAIRRDLAVALVSRSFGSLHRSGKAAPEIVDLCAGLVSNRALRAGIEAMRSPIISGGSTLAEAFAKTGFFPPLACLAIDAGEQSGTLCQSLERVAAHHAARARARIGAAIAILNPLLTLAVVGTTGIVMISFFQAVYQVVYATR
jgi:general secretion pathway protein F